MYACGRYHTPCCYLGVRHAADVGDVEDALHRVGWRLDHDELGVLRDHRRQVGWSGASRHVHVPDLDVHARRHLEERGAARRRTTWGVGYTIVLKVHQTPHCICERPKPKMKKKNTKKKLELHSDSRLTI